MTEFKLDFDVPKWTIKGNILKDMYNWLKTFDENNLDEAEINSENSKFLTHILNGVIKTIQDNFKNVEATAEFDTTNTDNIVIKLKGNTLDLIDATSYLAKAVRNDDVDFKFDDNIENNTVTCYIQPK